MQKEKWEAQLYEAQTQRDQFHRKNSQIAVLRFALFILSAWSFFSWWTAGTDTGRSSPPVWQAFVWRCQPIRKTIGSFWKRKPGSVY